MTYILTNDKFINNKDILKIRSGMTEVEGIDRLKEIIQIAHKLKWVYPPDKTSYPLMQLSEVEKCMVAMFDDFELGRMRKWIEESQSSEQKPKEVNTND